MWKAFYLMDVEGLKNITTWEALLDQERLQKYRQLRNEKTARLSLGAGLLLQLAVGEFLTGETSEIGGTKEIGELRSMTAENYRKRRDRAMSLLQDRGEPLLSFREYPDETGRVMKKECFLDLKYWHNQFEKPYFSNVPLFFSLSHSGTAVFCGCSNKEIGCDVQLMTEHNRKLTIERFFSKEEISRLDDLRPEMKREAFYRLWAKKEAYGKMLGEGVLKVLGQPLPEEGVNWQEGECTFDDGMHYQMAICEKSDI